MLSRWIAALEVSPVAPMDIAERLNALELKKRQKQMILDAVRAGAVPGVQPAAELLSRPPAAPPAEQLLEQMSYARLVDDGGARVLVFESRIDIGADQPYRMPLAHEQSLANHEALRRIYPDLEELDCPDCCRVAFLDTETTGLAGGTGTVPFLIGVGWFERAEDGRLARFVVEQYLIEDFCHEPLQLSLMAERLAQFDAFCTYNGRSFDLPLLRTRAVMNRMRQSMLRKPHMDLLPFSRRLWKGAFESVSLRSVETNVFGIEREQDVDGALIPQIWSDFARTGHCGRMPLVIHHNAQDIATLGCLLALHARCVEAAEEPGVLRRASECRGMARWFERAGERERACRLYERALELTNDGDEELKLLYHLARLYRRNNNWERAVEIWSGIKDRSLAAALPAWIELAKYYEHRARNLHEARELIQRCLKRMELEEELRLVTGRSFAGLIDSMHAEKLRKRLDRVETRLAKLRRSGAAR